MIRGNEGHLSRVQEQNEKPIWGGWLEQTLKGCEGVRQVVPLRRVFVAEREHRG